VVGASVSDPKQPRIENAPEPDRAVRFSLLYRGHRFELRPGTLMLGRGAGCQLVLDDALVSRKHAQIVVKPEGAVLEDLGSVNGVFVNGERVSGNRPLRDGDRIVIGQQEIVVFAAATPSLLPESPTTRLSADTLVGASRDELMLAVPNLGASSQESEATHQGDALALLGGVVDKMLAMGRGEESERVIGSYLRSFLVTARKSRSAERESAEKAVAYAVKLASATKRAEWAEYPFELFQVLARPLPTAVVDQLYTVLRQVPSVRVSLIRDYVSTLRAAADRFGPADRFLLQRIEGLERLASA